jgi:hypothetical protein
MKQNRVLVAVGALVAICVPALVVAQVARFEDGVLLDDASLNSLVDAVNGEAAGAPTFVETLAVAAGGTVTRIYTARGDGVVTFVPAANGVRGVTASISTSVNGTASTIARAFDGNSVTIAVRNTQQFTLTEANSSASAAGVNVYWMPMRRNAPGPTF